MKLFQKNLLHTGYFILKDGTMRPAFSSGIMQEALNSPYSSKIDKVYGTNSDQISFICQQIKEYKDKYGVVPRYLMDELRTGFRSGYGLRQTSYHFIT